MPLPRKRELECYLNTGTLHDLIISHLHNIGVIRDTEEVTEVKININDNDPLLKLIVRFEPDTQVIFHV